MDHCICCKQPCRETRVIEVQTLHLRELSGEKRIQALGRIVPGSVCNECAADQLAKMKNPMAGVRKSVIGYMILAILGAVLLFFVTDLPLRIPCIAAAVLGLLGTWNTVHKARLAGKHLAGLSPDAALEEARRQRMLSALPKKSTDSDLTYLPMTPVLAEVEPLTLMEQYDLLPAIAKQLIRQAKERYVPESLVESEAPKAEAAL